MKNFLKKVHIFLRNHLALNSEKTEHLFIPYSLLCICSITVFYIFNELGYALYEKEIFATRIICLLACCCFTAKNYWSQNFQNLKKYLWPVLLLFTLPFFDFYIAIVNNFNELLMMNFMIGVFHLIILTNIFLGITLVIIGMTLASIVCFMINRELHIFTLSPLFVQNMIYTMYVFASSAFMLYIKYKAEKSQLNAVKNLAKVIAHEIRTPLSTISTYSTIINQPLSDLIDDHNRFIQFAKDNQKTFTKAGFKFKNTNNYQFLTESLNIINEETKHAFVVIDMLLMQISIQHKTASTFSLISAKEIIVEAIRRYNFLPDEKNILHLNVANDFLILGDFTLILHILFNLFKNALYAIKKYQKGTIYIWTEKNKKYNEIHFRDTSIGINPAILPFIFNSFFSDKSFAGGIGLSFCKKTMEMFDGKIFCKTDEGQFTEFILAFPIVATVR